MRHVGGMALKFTVAIGTVVYGVPPFILFLVPLVWLHLYVARGVSLLFIFAPFVY